MNSTETSVIKRFMESASFDLFVFFFFIKFKAVTSKNIARSKDELFQSKTLPFHNPCSFGVLIVTSMTPHISKPTTFCNYWSEKF